MPFCTFLVPDRSWIYSPVIVSKVLEFCALGWVRAAGDPGQIRWSCCCPKRPGVGEFTARGNQGALDRTGRLPSLGSLPQLVGVFMLNPGGQQMAITRLGATVSRCGGQGHGSVS